MTLQIVLFALLALATVAFVALPLLRKPRDSAVRAEYDLRVFKDQLTEIDRDVERGLLTEEQAGSARLEIQRRMLAADSEIRAAKARVDARGPRLVAAAVSAILLPVGAVALYGLLGAPGLPDQPFAARQAERMGVQTAELDALRGEMDRLAARLEQGADDQEGWLELATGRKSLEQYDKALAAYDRALRLGPVPSDVWSEVGETQVMVGQGQVNAQAQAAFRNALRVDRREPRARYYLGLGEVQSGDPLAGLAIWRDLSADSPPNAPWMPMLRQRMAQVAQGEGVMPIAVTPAHPLDLADGTATVTVDENAAQRAEADANRPAGQGFTADEQAMVQGMVAGLAERLKEAPDDYDGWMRLGRSYMVLGQPEQAAEAYAGAIRARPEDMQARFNRAMVLLEVDGGAGQAFFDQVAEIQKMSPDSADSRYLGGLAAQAKGDVAEARRLWTALLDDLPEGSEARTAIEKQLRSLGNGAG